MLRSETSSSIKLSPQDIGVLRFTAELRIMLRSELRTLKLSPQDIGVLRFAAELLIMLRSETSIYSSVH